MSLQIQLRRGLAVDWSANDPILAQAEIGVELDTRKFKIGDGIHNWNSLSYGGLVGPQGAPGTAELTVLSPLKFDTSTQTLSLDNPLDGISISGGNF